MSEKIPLHPLKKGKFAVVDDEDYEMISRYKWSLQAEHRCEYAVSIYTVGGKKKAHRMHRMILNAPSDMVVDHINHDGLDNRRSNIRLCTRAENNRNSRKTKINTTSKYKGVYYGHGRRTRYKWRAVIYAGNKMRCIGNFRDEKSAAIAYNNEAAKIYGEFACLNEI